MKLAETLTQTLPDKQADIPRVQSPDGKALRAWQGGRPMGHSIPEGVEGRASMPEGTEEHICDGACGREGLNACSVDKSHYPK